MKILVLFVFFVACVIASLPQKLLDRDEPLLRALEKNVPTFQTRKYRAVGPEVLQFLEGFADGLGADFGNVTECTQDLNMTIDNFGAGYHYVQRGIDNFSPKDLSAGLKLWGLGLKDLRMAIVQCGTQDLVNDIDQIISDFSSEIGVFKFAIEELENVFKHRTELKQDFEAAETAWGQNDFRTVGFNTGKIVGILIEAAN